MPLPEAIIAVVAPFRPLFTAPTWRKLMTLLTGTLLAHGRRTVCSALRFSGEQMNENWSQYHQVLNRARWSPLAARQCFLLLIVDTLVPNTSHFRFYSLLALCKQGDQGGRQNREIAHQV
jgi:hypothetical protein